MIKQRGDTCRFLLCCGLREDIFKLPRDQFKKFNYLDERKLKKIHNNLEIQFPMINFYLNNIFYLSCVYALQIIVWLTYDLQHRNICFELAIFHWHVNIYI